MGGEVIYFDKPSKKGDTEKRNRDLEKLEGSVGGEYPRVYIQTYTVSKQQIRQNLRYKIQKTKKSQERSTWVAQLAECLALDFSSGHDPGVVGSRPML